MIPKLYKVISGKYVDDTLNYLLAHQGGGVSVNTFTQDIVLTGNTIPLDTGFYNTGNYGLFIGSQTLQNIIFGSNEIIYVDTSTLTIVGSLVSIAYDLSLTSWTIQDNQKIENEITNNRDKIPTSQAVYNGLATKQNTLTAGQGISIVNNVISATGGGGGVTVTNLTQDIVISGNTIPLATGFYNTDTHYIYLGSSIASNIVFGQGEIIYVDNGTLSLIGSFVSLYYDLATTTWTLQENNYIENQVSNNRSKIPTSQAVYNALGEKQDSLTAGTGIEINNNVISANSTHNYSTSERVVGTWTNGKPLYEKVITGTTPTVSTEGTAVHSETEITGSTNIDVCFITNAFVKYSNNNSIWSCPYYNNDMRFVKAQLTRGTNQVWKTDLLSNGTVYNNCTYTIVVCYTKTTD